MDFKKVIKDNFGVVLAVIIGLAIIGLYQGFFKEGALFETFTKDILEFCMQLIKDAIGMPGGEG